MKKAISLLLALALCLSLCACDGEDESNTCNHEWLAATCTTPESCALCGEEKGSALGHTTTNGICARCHEHIGDDTVNDTASYIAHCFMQYDEDSNCFRFSFALQDENKVDTAVDATVEMRIENAYGIEVYQGTKFVTANDYREWNNAFNRWLGTAVYIPMNEITAGEVEKGTLYYKVTVPDGTYFQYSVAIDKDLPVEDRTLGMGDVWSVNDNWLFRIDKVETHYACGSESSYRNNNLAQYIIISYSYENIGFDYYTTGLEFNFTDFKVCDEMGELGEYYGCYEHTKDAEYVNIGMKCSLAQVVFGLNNQSSTIRIDVSHSSDYGELKTTYIISIDEHTHSFGEWKTIKQETCTAEGSKERTCSCGAKEIAPIEKSPHNYSSGKCSTCGSVDPGYKTPDLILGEYVQRNGAKQYNGKYMVSWQKDETTVTQIYWDPSDKTLLFAEQKNGTTAVTTAGILYEFGVNKQRITVINDQTATGVSNNKITGIGYIYAYTYSISNNNIYSYSCDASGALETANKSLAEACITVLIKDIDEYLRKNTNFTIADFGFTAW